LKLFYANINVRERSVDVL